MSDLIRLLPDSVANQIAAGEVVQRPASAVKELLENTIDAGATGIKLIIKEAGKMLIQVVDDGCGMSPHDARMCFERHATSKISSAHDLFSIRTLGFRGEALASIASVAQVELRTRVANEELGTLVVMEGSEFKEQSPVSCPSGTSISVRNLFFNVPARRNFLKSNTLELKYIIEEFFRIALVNPSIAFTFYNHDKILYQLPSGNLRQRIINLYGSGYGQRLIPVEQQTELVNIGGFIGKPEFARKSRGEQYFFTNGRFMKSGYLHHAVESAFKELIPSDSYPSYFLYLEVDPGQIDVNIHPTKTEINFQDIKSIYAILHAAVRQAIGKFNLAPTIDFSIEQSLQLPPVPPGHVINQPTISVNPAYNPFENRTEKTFSFPQAQPQTGNPEAWKRLYEPEPDTPPQPLIEVPLSTRKQIVQVENSYIVTHTRTGIVVIDQQNAHERILYERIVGSSEGEPLPSVRLLLPHTLHLSVADASLIESSLDQIQSLGFEIESFGKGSFVIHAVPAAIDSIDPQHLLEALMESLKDIETEEKTGKNRLLAKGLATRNAVKRGKMLRQEEMESIVESLFACQVPDLSPAGKPTLHLISFDDLTKKFKSK